MTKLKTSGLSHPEAESLLKMLLAMAESRNDLCRMHNEVLDGSTRLCREDFVAFEEFWLYHFKAGLPTNSQRMNKVQEYFLLNFIVREGSFDDYYAHLIQKASRNIYWTKWELDSADEHWQIVYSNPDRSGHGEYHYKVRIFDFDFDLACKISRDAKMRVLLGINGPDLTEELTHKIVSELPEFDLFNSTFSTNTGRYLELVYDIDSSGIVDHINQTPKTAANYQPMKIASQMFLQSLVERLIEMGIPITQAETVE